MTLPLLTIAPAAVNCASENCASTPAPDSMTTSRPARVSLEIMSGTRATRFSPGRVSLGTEIRTYEIYSHDPVLRTKKPANKT